MDAETLTSADTRVPDAIYELVKQLLNEGASPSEISFHLTAHALSLGIQLAPSPFDAVSVVTSALAAISQAHSTGGLDGVPGSSDVSELEKVDDEPIVVKPDSKIRSIH